MNESSPTRPPRGRSPSAWCDLTWIGVVLAAILAGVLVSPAEAGHGTVLTLFGIQLPNICWFRAFTGRNCAGCGLTRAWALLLHGRLTDSWVQHPFAGLFLTLALLSLAPPAARLWRRGTEKKEEGTWEGPFRLWLHRAMAASLTLLLAWWVVSLIRG